MILLLIMRTGVVNPSKSFLCTGSGQFTQKQTQRDGFATATSRQRLVCFHHIGLIFSAAFPKNALI